MTRTSAAVTTTATARANPATAASNLLQRKCACGNQAGFDGECEDCRDEKLRRKPGAGGRLGSRRAPSIVHDVLRQPGAPIEPTTRAFMEARFDRSFADVRIHAEPQAARSAAAVDAHAYTVGRHIAFAEGRYEPQTSRGRKLLAHELAHAAGNAAGSPPEIFTIAEAHGSAAEAQAEQAETWVERGDPGRSAVATTTVASPGRVQRKGRSVGGWFANVWSFIRGIFTTPFSAKQLQEYLKLLADSNDIEADYESQRKARLVVQEWRHNHATYPLNGKLMALLIREMMEGGAAEDDKKLILDLLDGATVDELLFIFGPGTLTLGGLLKIYDTKPERERLEALYRKRYKLDAVKDIKDVPAQPEIVAFAEELRTYLKTLDQRNDIEHELGSKVKARQVLHEWKSNPAAHDLTPKLKLLLIRQLLEASSVEDRHLILDLLGTAAFDDLLYIYDAGGQLHAQLIAAFTPELKADRDRLEAFYNKRYGITDLSNIPQNPLPNPTTYEEALAEGARRVVAAGFGLVGGDVSFLPDNKDGYDSRDWKEETKASARPGVIVAKVEPWLAVKNLFDNLGKNVPAAIGHGRMTKWHFDCWEGVNVLQIYALWRMLDRKAFDGRFTRLEIKRKVTRLDIGRFSILAEQEWGPAFQQDGPDKAPYVLGEQTSSVGGGGATLTFDVPKVPVGKTMRQLLDEAPIGSQVIFTNQAAVAACGVRPELSYCNYSNENSTKLGRNRFFAFPFGDVPEQKIIDEMVKAVFDDPRKIPADYIAKNIYISAIRHPKNPPPPRPGEVAPSTGR